MQIKVTRIEDGPARVEVIDPTDGAVTNTTDVNVGEQVVINALTARTPADFEVCAVEPTPEPEAEAETPKPGEPGSAAAGEGDAQPEDGEAEGAEQPADADAEAGEGEQGEQPAA